jgi:hypothetical protein
VLTEVESNACVEETKEIGTKKTSNESNLPRTEKKKLHHTKLLTLLNVRGILNLRLRCERGGEPVGVLCLQYLFVDQNCFIRDNRKRTSN